MAYEKTDSYRPGLPTGLPYEFLCEGRLFRMINNGSPVMKAAGAHPGPNWDEKIARRSHLARRTAPIGRVKTSQWHESLMGDGRNGDITTTQRQYEEALGTLSKLVRV